MNGQKTTVFFLNGKHLYFKGMNVHQGQAGWGDAVADAAARRDVASVKQAGFDMIRGSHYPHSENNKDWIVVSDKTGNHVPLDSDLIKSDR